MIDYPPTTVHYKIFGYENSLHVAINPDKGWNAPACIWRIGVGAQATPWRTAQSPEMAIAAAESDLAQAGVTDIRIEHRPF